MHAKRDPQLPINDARKLYLELREQGNNNTYLIEVPAYTHFNVLGCDTPKRNQIRIKAIQAIYKKHGLPYNKDILNNNNPDLSQFQPSTNEVQKRINDIEWKKRIFTYASDGLLLGLLAFGLFMQK